MDPFSDYPTSLTSPAREAMNVTPHDAVDLGILPRAIYVGVGGDLSVRMPSGQTVLFQGVVSGTLLPLRAAGINATGTTATGIVAMW